MNKPPIEVNCPTCQQKVEWITENKHRPFCSDRCQLIDLGAWANEEYSIPAPPDEQWSEQSSAEGSAGETLQ